MQNDLDRETANLQDLEAQKQDAQDRLEEMDQQKHKLEDVLNEIQIKCQEESHMVRTFLSYQLQENSPSWFHHARSLEIHHVWFHFTFRSQRSKIRSIPRSRTCSIRRRS